MVLKRKNWNSRKTNMITCEPCMGDLDFNFERGCVFGKYPPPPLHITDMAKVNVANITLLGIPAYFYEFLGTNIKKR